MEIRFVEKKDSQKILDIYTPYIEDTVITFEYEVPSIAEFTNRITSISTTMPYLVAEKEGEILGYAYASQYKARDAYQWAVEVSIYVDTTKKQKGVGTALYDTLLAILKEQGYYRAFACISNNNPGSIRFHKKYDFKEIGVFHQCGYKLGQWVDVIWMERELQKPNNDPLPVTPISQIILNSHK